MSEFKERFDTVLFQGRYEHFEDGYTSRFSDGLLNLYKENPSYTITLFTEEIEKSNLDDGFNWVIGEGLRWLGRQPRDFYWSERLDMMRKAIKSQSGYVRDGGYLGIASMDDFAILPDLHAALEFETQGWYKADILEIIEQLEKTKSEYEYKRRHTNWWETENYGDLFWMSAKDLYEAGDNFWEHVKSDDIQIYYWSQRVFNITKDPSTFYEEGYAYTMHFEEHSVTAERGYLLLDVIPVKTYNKIVRETKLSELQDQLKSVQQEFKTLGFEMDYTISPPINT